MLKNNDKRRIFIRRSSFDCHITDSDMAPCSVCFTCMLRLSWLCGVHVGRCGVWRWMVRAGAGGQRVWMLVVPWNGCGIRIWTEFPLTEFAEILSRKAVKFCIYSINYVGILKPLWYTCLSTHDYYCECNLKVEGSIPVGAHFFTLYSNNNSDKLLVLLDSYWTPVYPFLRNLQFLMIPVGLGYQICMVISQYEICWSPSKVQ